MKEHDRACLDAAPWSAGERDRIIDEVLAAYELTSRLLSDLDAATA